MPPLPEVTAFLAAHGSMLILPVAIVEGPVVAVIAGALSAAGILDWPWALLMLVLGDLIGDCIYYAIGRYGGMHHRSPDGFAEVPKDASNSTASKI